MKCSVCGKELSSGGQCEHCGQPQTGRQTAESVKKHWESAEAETRRYESKRDKATAKVREEFRQQRVGGRWGCGLMLVALIVLVFVLEGTGLLTDSVDYMNAWWAMEQGEYVRAAELFDRIDSDFLGTRDHREYCQEQVRRATYDEAVSLYDGGDYDQALGMFDALGDYADCRDYARSCTEYILRTLESPVSHWSFEADFSEDSGIESGIRGDAQVRRVVDSRITTAAAFDGSGDYITGGTGANMTEDWTLTVQFAPRSLENVTILTKMDWETGHAPYRLCIRDEQLVWQMTTEDGQTVELVTRSRLHAAEQWYQVAVVKEGMTVTLYLNGEAADSVVLPSPVITGEETLTIGDQPYHGEDAGFGGFHGYIGDVAIYERSVTPLALELSYEAMEYDATHLWDTSFYWLTEGEYGDFFVFFRSEVHDNQMMLAILDVRERSEAVGLVWNPDKSTLCFDDETMLLCYDWYCLEGETWVLVEEDVVPDITFVSEVLSSDLPVYDLSGQVMLEPVIIGGRG